MCWETAYEQWLNAPALSQQEQEELRAIQKDKMELRERFCAPFGFRYRRDFADDESGSTPYECPCCPVGDPGICRGNLCRV